MTSEKQTQKLPIDDASDLGSVSDWMKQTFNQSEALPRYEVTTRHQYGISALVLQTSFCRETSFVSNNSTSVHVFFMLLSVGLYVFCSSPHNDEA